MVLAVIIFFTLPDSPDTAGFLTEEEREVAKARAILQTGMEGKDRVGGVKFREVLSAFSSPQTLIQPLMVCCTPTTRASYPRPRCCMKVPTY